MSKVIHAALTKEQGITFVAVSVNDSVIGNSHEANNVINAMAQHFGCPVVLVGAQRHRVYGFRKDIVDFVANNWRGLPWRQWTIAA